MATQEREIVDLLWDNDRADALEKLKDMLQVKLQHLLMRAN